MGPSPALDGPLWHANGPLARVLAATIPSGDPVIVDLRMEIGFIIGFTVPDVFLPVEWETPVLNFDDVDRPWPASSIYVGHGPHGCGMNPSPWGSPYASTSMADSCPYDERFILYAEARADVVYWLRPLVGKKLICHCSQKCHATQLVALIGKHFKHGEVYRSSQPPFGLHEASCSVAPSDVAPVDPINGGSGDPMIAPYPGGSWPDEWRALVENIRGAPYGMAWEIFSGCQSITRALSHRGWTCAPPVDISYSSWFNVLNPVFASIIVGIILEGRITLLVLDPPEGGPPTCARQSGRWLCLFPKLCSELVGTCFGVVMDRNRRNFAIIFVSVRANLEPPGVKGWYSQVHGVGFWIWEHFAKTAVA